MWLVWFGFFAKVFGSGLIIAVGTLLGYRWANGLANELGELEKLELALVNLSAEISYALSPLPKALWRSGQKVGGGTGELLSRMGSSVGLEQRRTPAEALDEALKNFDGSGVGLFEIELLKNLARNLGTSGHKEQLRYIESCIDKLRTYRRTFEEECKRKMRLYRYLGVLSALSIVIVLI